MKKKSIRSKIFWMNVILVLVAVGLFDSYITYRIHEYTTLMEETNQEQNEIIMLTASESILNMTEDSFRAYVTAEAKLIDGEFWTMKHDLEMLAVEVQHLLSDDGAYSPEAILPPSAANAGKLTMQLLYSEDANPNSPVLQERIGRVSELGGMMMEIVEGGESMTDCFISLVGGATIIADSVPEAKLDASGRVLPSNAETRPWYIGAVAHGTRVWFSPPSRDNYYDAYEVMAGIPVYVNNKLAAICGGSLRMDALSQIVAEARLGGESSDVCLINENGVLIYSSRETGELGMSYDTYKRLRSAGNTDLVALVNLALEGQSGFTLLDLDGELTYIAYAPLETVGWTQMLLISQDEMYRAALNVTEQADDVLDSSIRYMRSTSGSLGYSIAIIALMLIALAVILSLFFAKRITNPIKHMTRRVSEMEGSDMTFRLDASMQTGDEIEVLARAFAGMSEKMRGYVAEIVQFTADKQRLDTELSVAADIQSNMLPSHFPAFPDRTDFDLYAVMDPAKEVGGDFFDFFLIDENRLALVMADVSGKGVPASLFMMISKVLIKNAALSGENRGPGEILRVVNNQLCEGNQDNMFVTVWLGILDLTDGSLVSASAGHEYPVFYREKTGFTLEKQEKHGLVMGAVEGVRFRETRWQMDPGDLLFLYTDGVPEATNAQKKLFGNERMLQALSDSLPLSRGTGKTGVPDLKILLWDVRREVDRFVGEAPQFDDLTMMCVAYYGKDGTPAAQA